MPLCWDIQQAINHAIAASDYRPPLPKLGVEVWNKVLDWKTNKCHNNCLEWLGDGLMYAAISVELYRQVPKGTPDMFTKIRAPIVSNQTFALLTNKLNLSDSLIHTNPNPQPLTAKCFADLFEVLPAEIYMREGFDVLRDWVAAVFGSLIAAGVSAYEKFHERQPADLNKRKWDEELDSTTRLWNKRQKTNHKHRNKVWVRPVVAPTSKPTSSGASSGHEQVSNPVLRDVPSSNQDFAKQSTNGAPLPARDVSSHRKAMGRSDNALSEIFRNAAGSSKDVMQNVQVRSPRPVKLGVSSGNENPVTVHRAAWKQALARAPNSLPSRLEEAVLTSPSRYISAAPSAPACGPGSSRFDPIIIDDEDEPGEKENATSGSSREVIELLDDDDLEQVEKILVPAVPTLKELGRRKPL